MPKTVNIAGHPVPRGVVITGVVAVVAGGGYYLYKKSVSAQTSTATGAASGQYGYGQYGYGQYGYGNAYGYGSAGYGQYSAYPAEENYGYGEYGYGMYGPGGGYYGSGFPPTSTVPPVAQTNQAWAQAAVAAMVAQGFNATTVSTAIGLYLNGKPVTSAQEQLITTATGLEGDPPQDGVAGYPPAIHTTSTTHKPKPTDVTVPNVTGIDYQNASKIMAQVGLKAKRGRPNVGIVASESPKAGTKVKKGTTVTLQGRPEGRKPR